MELHFTNFFERQKAGLEGAKQKKDSAATSLEADVTNSLLIIEATAARLDQESGESHVADTMSKEYKHLDKLRSIIN